MAARLNYVYLCLVSLLISCSPVTVKGNTQKLYFLLLLPYPESTRPSDHNAGTNVFLGGQIAVELINNRSDILHGYELELIEAASGCSNELHGILSFTNEVFHSAWKANKRCHWSKAFKIKCFAYPTSKPRGNCTDPLSSLTCTSLGEWNEISILI